MATCILLCANALTTTAQQVADIRIENSTDTLANDTLPWQQILQTRIENILIDSMFAYSTMGLKVYDLTEDTTLYSWNERQTLRPASTMKLLTAISALDRLGGEYEFKTALYYDGTIENRKFTGDLVCKGGMDPLFNNSNMTTLIDRLRALEIDTLQGRLMADLTMKDTLIWGEGWCWDDDNPLLTPLLLNKKDGFMERLTKRLNDVGVVTDSMVTCEGKVAPEAKLLTTISHHIDHVLMTMMKNSDNLYAEAMFYQLAASTGAERAGAEQAREVIADLIRRLGLNPDSYRIADGSGLSLYDYLSAELEVELLKYAWQRRTIYDHLLPSLPIAGVDGTLKKRMKGTAAEGNVHAKTGTVTGVSSLAGYCTAPNGHLLCFSIINQGVLTIRQARTIQDRLCEAMCAPQTALEVNTNVEEQGVVTR